MGQRRAPTRYLRTSEAAAILQVSPKTITRWALEGKLPLVRTLGGHARYSEADLRKILADNTVPAAETGGE